MRLLLLIFLISIAQHGYTQTLPEKPIPGTQSPKKKADLQQPSEEQEIKKESPFAIFKMFSGNPGKAMLYSAVLPGAGQIYNKRWWKAPIVWGIEGTAIGILAYNQNQYQAWKKGHAQLVSGAITSFGNTSSPATALKKRDLWENNRDYAIIGLIAVHLIQMTDAFINRHLIEFDVSDDLSIDFNPINPYPGLNLVVHF